MASFASGLFKNDQRGDDLGPAELARAIKRDSAITDEMARGALDNYSAAGRNGDRGFKSKSVNWDQSNNRFTTATNKVPDDYKSNWIDLGDGTSYFSREGAPAVSVANSPEALQASAGEARQRAEAAQTKIQETVPKVTYEQPDRDNAITAPDNAGNQPRIGVRAATDFGNEMRDWSFAFNDSLKKNSLQQIAETKQSMMAGIRGLPAGLKLPEKLDIAALYKQYASGLG